MNGPPHNRNVIVIGAGPAGVTAAAAASAGGANVVLVESTHRLGGSVTAAMHRSICGLYADTANGPLDTLNDSWQRKVVERMLAYRAGGADPARSLDPKFSHHAATEAADFSSTPHAESATPVAGLKSDLKLSSVSIAEPGAVRTRQFGKAWVLEFPPAAWEFSLESILYESKIERRMGTRVVSVAREGNRITAIELEGDHPGRLEPAVLVDCTGGGSLLQLIGEDAMLPADDPAARVLGGYGVRLAGITGHLELLRLQIPYALAKAVQGGELPAIARFTVFYPGPGEGEGVCKLAMPAGGTSDRREHGWAARATDGGGGDSCDGPAGTSTNAAAAAADSGSSIADDAKAFANAVIAILQRDVPGFATAKVIERSPHILPRDGRRLRGRFVLTEEDVLTARKHGGDSVRAWWPIERWDAAEGPQYAYPPVGDHYDIPPASLRSEKFDNLLAAGNAISATAGAAASSRASGICLATGAAAGRLAGAMIADGSNH